MVSNICAVFARINKLMSGSKSLYPQKDVEGWLGRRPVS